MTDSASLKLIALQRLTDSGTFPVACIYAGRNAPDGCTGKSKNPCNYADYAIDFYL